MLNYFGNNTTNVWTKRVISEANKWGHILYKITGIEATRRSIVLWSCSKHPNGGRNTFQSQDVKLNELLKKDLISSIDIAQLIMTYPGEQFYASRVDEYLKLYKPKSRTICCREKLNKNRSLAGFEVFKKQLLNRGDHYRTQYTLQINDLDYKGKHIQYPIKCESHGLTFNYSMQNLNYTTSCPCPECRIDPNHKNNSVEIIKKRNAGRPGQVVRHALQVKKKYDFTCALSNSTLDLHYHHLDGQDFYTETQLLWMYNGICLSAAVHRDYHYNFLLNYSLIAKEYLTETFNSNKNAVLTLSSKISTNEDNPDLLLANAEVSRYTFLEYLKFLKFDMKINKSVYVKNLNKKIKVSGQITPTRIERAIEIFCKEYKGKNWALASRNDIPYANSVSLWFKVENTWQ